MILGSKAFFVFLPVVLIGYHLLAGRTRKYAFLLVASWVFYAFAAWYYLSVLLALTVIDYLVAHRIEASDDDRVRKRWLVLSVVSNLGLLAAFKYLPFAYDTGVSVAHWFGHPAADRAWQILLPLGISFHTFQGISYTVDVYRRQIRAVRSFLDYALFVAFFPQLAAGPIVRAVEFLPQMVAPPRVTAQQITDGTYLFLFGLFKKLFVADQLDQLFVSPVFANPEAFDAATHRWAVIAWAVQIYCDFSGYTDIAIGTAKWFGFELPPNFRLPYLATSIADFWRRWHLSFSTWLRDYVYFPMGGSRGSVARTYFNLIVLFVLCGLWHGAEWRWVAYGAYNGLLMGLHRTFDRTAAAIPWAVRLRSTLGWKLFAWTATMFILLGGLVLIRMADWPGGLLVLRSLVGIGHDPVAATGAAFAPWVWGAPLAVPVLIALGLVEHVGAAARSVRLEVPEPVKAVAAASCAVLVVVLGPGAGKAFIYIQF